MHDLPLKKKKITEKESDTVPKIPKRSRGDVLSWVLFGLLVIFFLVLKSYSIHWQTGDENVYAYMAWAGIDHGALPYADYFFAHPLLHLLPGMLLFGIMGFSPLSIRIIPVTATVIGALFLFLLAKKKVGRTGAVATVFLYLTAFSLLRASTHWTGINLSVMWMIIGLWALTGRRPAVSGVCMALGVCTGNYVLPAAIMAGMLALLQSKKDAVRYLIGFTIPWTLVQLLSLILGGQSYLDAVYLYHVHKPDKEGVFRFRLIQVFTDNAALCIGALSGSILAAMDTFLSQGKDGVGNNDPSRSGEWGVLKIWLWLRQCLIENNGKSIALTGTLWTLGYLIFISMLANVFPFYFLLLFPAMALTGGYAVARYAHLCIRLLKNIKHRDKFYWAWASALGLTTIAVIMAFLVIPPLQHSLLPNYIRKADKPMKWSDAPLPPFVNNLFHACCFDDVARAYTDYGTLQELLYHESRYFEKAEEIGQYLTTNSTPEQTLFGDAATAGLMAILSGRRIEADFVDTNTMRFTSGITPVEEAIHRIDTKNLTFIIVYGSIYRGKNGKIAERYSMFAGLPAFNRWLRENFHEVYRTYDPSKGWYFLLKRKTYEQK